MAEKKKAVCVHKTCAGSCFGNSYPAGGGARFVKNREKSVLARANPDDLHAYHEAGIEYNRVFFDEEHLFPPGKRA